MKIERWVDGALGEAREALACDGRIFALRILRHSDVGGRAAWGEAYRGRVLSLDRARRGAFVELGLRREQGFLPLGRDGRVQRGGQKFLLRDGDGVCVSIAREGVRGKSPVLNFVDFTEGAPGLIEASEAQRELLTAVPDLAHRAAIDDAIEEALAPMAPLPGGGVLSIEPTAALVAIDVDAGARQGPRDGERFALELNCAAAREAAFQLRLRGLGGVVAIDFVSLQQAASRRVLLDHVKAAFAGDPWPVQFGGLSRFGVFELARAQLVRPLHEIYCDGHSRLSVESIALRALRRVELEARAFGGRRIMAGVAPEVFAWLEGTSLAWRSQLTERIGARFVVEAMAGAAREFVDVRAV